MPTIAEPRIAWPAARFALVVALLTLMLGVLATPSAAQPRREVTFSVAQTTTPGQSVYVLGDLPELGGGDLRKAVKLEPFSYPTWKATISLPSGRNYTYRYYLRNDGPGQGGLASNGVPVGSLQSASTPAPAPPLAPVSKTALFHSTWSAPVLNWRHQGSTEAFRALPMKALTRARTAQERRFGVYGFGEPRRGVEFYFTNGGGGGGGGVQRDPASGVYSTNLDAALVQDGQVYSYLPAAAVSAQRRDYSASSPPGINSANLNGEFRRYRVLLPRGYDSHPERRYPVLYMHDGQNVFEVGPFGSWNAHTTAEALTRAGRMREVIIVGVDNGPNRLSDYAAPDAGGQANRYVAFLTSELKPRIDSQYRTLTGADTTGAMGSSMGAHVSLYMGWDSTSTYTRVGALSGAFEVFSSGFYNRVRSQPKRAIRLYLDSGDAGTASDNYWPIYNLRDNLLNPARPGGTPFRLEGDLRHVVGQGQQHNEAAWAARLPEALTFLYPASEAEGELFGLYGPQFDVDGDGIVTIDDLHAQAGPGARDVNLDGSVDSADLQALEKLVRVKKGF